jgi:hypothetical protein
MKLHVDFSMDNAAFTDDGSDGSIEAARLLRKVAEELDCFRLSGDCYDLNGNTVGAWAIDLEPELLLERGA